MSSCSNFSLPSDPDIAGVGVRSAIYIQNFLCVIPAMLALLDKVVTPDELALVENQAAATVALSFSVLIATIVQAKTLGMSAYHAHIALNICSLSNSLVFVYGLLLAAKKSPPDSESQGTYQMFSSTSILSAQATIVSTLNINPFTEVDTPRLRVFVLSGLSMMLTGAIGLWLWSNPYSFNRIDGSRDEIDCVLIRYPVIFIEAHFSSKTLRRLSLAWYSFLLVDGLLVPIRGIATVSQSLDPETYFFHLIVILIANVLYIIPVELTLKANRHLQSADENVWSFGQTLALLVLLVPIWDAVKLLRSRDTDPPTPKDAITLHNAIDEEDFATLEQLLDRGVDPNMPATKGRKYATPLQTASQAGNLMIVNLLLEGGADPKIHGGESNGTPLETAASCGQYAIVKSLLSHGADPNEIGGKYGTALQAASYPPDRRSISDSTSTSITVQVQEPDLSSSDTESQEDTPPPGAYEIVELLLKKGAKPNIQAGEFGSALRAACYCANVNVVKLLLDHGADPNLPNTDGQKYASPLAICRQRSELDGKGMEKRMAEFDAIKTLLLAKGVKDGDVSIEVHEGTPA